MKSKEVLLEEKAKELGAYLQVSFFGTKVSKDTSFPSSLPQAVPSTKEEQGVLNKEDEEEGGKNPLEKERSLKEQSLLKKSVPVITVSKKRSTKNTPSPQVRDIFRRTR